MPFASYCAIQTIGRPTFLDRWTNAHQTIVALETYINNIIDPIRGQDHSIVVIPRFNGNYISFRFCGLEVFRVFCDGRLQFMLHNVDGKFKNCNSQNLTFQSVAVIPGNVGEMLTAICVFLQNYRMGPRDRQSRALIPGFHPEHWLESIILADNIFGVQNRTHLGINTSLAKCVTQVPASPGPNGNSARFIDILSVLDDATVKIVELKIDDSVETAEEELGSYTQWLSTRDYTDNYPFTPQVRWEQGYLPNRIDGMPQGGWVAPLTPSTLVVATAQSQNHTTVLLRENFINHILNPFHQ